VPLCGEGHILFTIEQDTNGFTRFECQKGGVRSEHARKILFSAERTPNWRLLHNDLLVRKTKHKCNGRPYVKGTLKGAQNFYTPAKGSCNNPLWLEIGMLLKPGEIFSLNHLLCMGETFCAVSLFHMNGV